MEREFTTLTDSFGKKIYEGDIVEYYDWCYCNEGNYTDEDWIKEGGNEKDVEGFINAAISNGYTIKHYYYSLSDEKYLVMYKPCIGIVKWNPEFVTYEPVIGEGDDYNNNSFHYVISNMDEGAYCKVIGNIIANPDLAAKIQAENSKNK